jgi:protein-tyrosine phosphatase
MAGAYVFENLYNFRDLGGLGPVRPRRLYRSDSVAYASAADAALLVGELGLATVVDLRGEREVARYGRGPLDVAYVAVPVTDLERYGSRAEYYVGVLAERGGPLADVLRRLAEPGALPALIHCEAGCDRTGVLAAVILDLAGVPDADICADFAATAAAVGRINERLARNAAAHGEVWPRPDDRDGLDWHPTAAMMAETLRLMRSRWGSAEGWARAYGLTTADLAALRHALTA